MEQYCYLPPFNVYKAVRISTDFLFTFLFTGANMIDAFAQNFNDCLGGPPSAAEYTYFTGLIPWKWFTNVFNAMDFHSRINSAKTVQYSYEISLREAGST